MTIRMYRNWRKSTRSDDGNCVEVAHADDSFVGVRDSKDTNSPILEFTPAAWTAFTDGVRDSRFDR